VKVCFKCRTAKPLSEFYAHPAMSDGYLGKCKECAKTDVRRHRLENLERVRAYDRSRAFLPHRAELRARVVRRWRLTHKDRVSAHNKAQRHLRSKPSSCQSCGLMTRVEGHHEDYSRPLDVMWLCKPCHAKADALRRAREANA
jgi:hypothetical protein